MVTQVDPILSIRSYFLLYHPKPNPERLEFRYLIYLNTFPSENLLESEEQVGGSSYETVKILDQKTRETTILNSYSRKKTYSSPYPCVITHPLKVLVGGRPLRNQRKFLKPKLQELRKTFRTLFYILHLGLFVTGVRIINDGTL